MYFNASQTLHPELFTDHHFRPDTHLFFSNTPVPLQQHDLINDFCFAQQLKRNFPWWGTRADFSGLGHEIPADAAGVTMLNEFQEGDDEYFNPEQLLDNDQATALSKNLFENFVPRIEPWVLDKFNTRRPRPARR